MIPVLDFSRPDDRQAWSIVYDNLRLDVRSLLLDDGALHQKTETVRKMLVDVATRGDEAVVELIRKFDDPNFDAKRLRVTRDEMKAAAGRVRADQLDALRRSIAQVRDYQTRILPGDVMFDARAGVRLGLRHTPLASAGIYAPGGKASYPSSLIMMAVPAIVAGVKRLVVVSPTSKDGDNDLVLAVAHELQIDEMYRVGGVAAFGALACGTQTIKPVDKLMGPGNSYVQLAKRLLSGAVGTDGFLGPSDILVIADETCVPKYVAADLLAQAEHDPGRCFLLTRSRAVADAVVQELARQLKSLKRAAAIGRSFERESAIVICPDDETLVNLANQIAAEHVNLQVKDPEAMLAKVSHGGAFFVGPHSPVAAGDYVCGPSHCLPTNTTARFAGGVSVYEFMKRSSLVQYEAGGLRDDASAIITIANAEGLDAHAASVRARME
jgi:histidinol dehydrogenase